MGTLANDIRIKSSGTEANIIGKDLFDFCLKKNHSIAIWRQPGEKRVNYIVHHSKELPEAAHPDLENIESGFLVSPYSNNSNQLNYLIKADIHFTNYNTESSGLNIQNYNLSEEELGNFILQVNECKRESTSHLEDKSKKKPISTDIDQNNFQSLVASAVDKIKAGEFQKVVPARVAQLDLSENSNIFEKFIALCTIHPFAFVSLFSIPDKGSWLGASPEILIKIDDNNIFYTSAVAGTQSAIDASDLTSVAWTQKEIEEQALVSRYIINCFKKIRLREFEESGPKTVKAGNLLHLRTDYKVDMAAVNFSQLGSVMLKLLHPTSAVCGMPKEPAAQFLEQYENFEREFFSGYLGPVNINNCSSLYVNLRCAKIIGQKAFLFAGAGVTADSVPEKEWNETEMKLRSIMQVF